MKLSLKPSNRNHYPLSGFLVKGSLTKCLGELQSMQVSLDGLEVYPIPGLIANGHWGFYMDLQGNTLPRERGLIQAVQSIEKLLFIPENCEIVPRIEAQELFELTKGRRVLAHPDFGFYELDKPIHLADHIVDLPESEALVRVPEDGVFVPNDLKSFQIKPVSPDEVMEKMQMQFPKKEPLKDKPLNPLEKLKLAFYKGIFKKKEGEEKQGQPSQPNRKDGTEIIAAKDANLSGLGSLFSSIGSLFRKNKNKASFGENMALDYEELQRRNQKEVQKLMDMLKNDPEAALKYAIPLDDQGTSRGDDLGAFKLGSFWSSLSLSGTRPGARGERSVGLGDHYFTLREQYEQTARNLKQKGEYEKAAFVYLKLLKDYLRAAQTLEEGKMYAESASIYLKKCNNTSAAANCYEKGYMLAEAAKLRMDLKQFEMAGDLLMKINQKKEAFICYTKAADEFIDKRQYVKASLIYKYKMDDRQSCQALLLSGWRDQYDEANCLGNYFSNIEKESELATQIRHIAQHEVGKRSRVFLEVILKQYHRDEAPKDLIKEMAYEMVSLEAKNNKSVVDLLTQLNQHNSQFGDDAFRFKLNKR